MADIDMEEDNAQELATQPSKHIKEETASYQPLLTPQTEDTVDLSTGSDSQPQSFDPSVPDSSNGSDLSSTPECLQGRGRKRDSGGNVKKTVAELDVRADLTKSRGTPRGRKPVGGLYFSKDEDMEWQWEALGLHSPIFKPWPKLQASPKTTTTVSSPKEKPKPLQEKRKEGNSTKNHKRQGSLLEWRNPELFEEPLRI